MKSNKLLREANDLLRTMNSIVKRKGSETNWESLDKKLADVLLKQHKYMYPTQYGNGNLFDTLWRSFLQMIRKY